MATDTDLGLGLAHDEERPPSRRRGSGRRGRVLLLLAALLALLGIAAGGVYAVGAVSRGLRPGDFAGPGTGAVTVQVRTGDTATDIGATLAAAGVVKTPEAFRQAADRDDRSKTIQPGYYRLRSQMSGAAALGLLLEPSSRLSRRAVVPEGTGVPATLAILAKATRIPLAKLQAAAAKPAALDLPPACRGQLEGCLYPATYLFSPGTTAADALGQLVDRFRQAADDLQLDAGAKALRVSPYQVLTIASLLEKEVPTVDFGKASRVVYNRLAKDMPLQFDSTVGYVLKTKRVHLTLADIKVKSPYNTYLNKGLPPTPINSPGEAALRAALKPTPGTWLYFVTIDKAGRTGFATDYPTFLKLKAQGARDR